MCWESSSADGLSDVFCVSGAARLNGGYPDRVPLGRRQALSCGMHGRKTSDPPTSQGRRDI